MGFAEAIESIGRVIEAMVVSPRPLKERVAVAVMTLEGLRASGAPLPPRGRAVLDALLAQAPGGRGAREVEALDLALQILHLEKDLWRELKEGGCG